MEGEREARRDLIWEKDDARLIFQADETDPDCGLRRFVTLLASFVLRCPFISSLA